MVYGHLVDHTTGEMIDDGMALVYRSPHSYTGEEMVELTLHGSPLILSLVIEQLCAVGARVAERGEFTRRAVLAGKLTLGGAEAVNDVILATNRSALRMSLTQMTGRFGTRVAELRSTTGGGARPLGELPEGGGGQAGHTDRYRGKP